MNDAVARQLRERIPDDFTPDLFVVLGSGLRGVADAVSDPVDVPMRDIEGLAPSMVPGHDAILRFGLLGGRSVLVQRGRLHLYEGYAAADVTRTVDAAAALGCTAMLITNAAGGLHDGLEPGDLLVISDQINLTATSPHIGVVRDGAPVFQDMTRAYDRDFIDSLHAVADDLGITLRQGVYAGLVGPAFETPAEVAMLRAMGADVVGMSTVLEVIAARSRGMRVAGVSLVTNVHDPDQAGVSHEEVLRIGEVAAGTLSRLLIPAIPRL